MQCAEVLRVQAFFDGELDAMSSAEIERHLEHCADCRSLLQDLGQVRAALCRELAYERAAPSLRARVLQALDQEAGAKPAPSNVRRSTIRPQGSFWSGVRSGVGCTAAAAALALFVSLPPFSGALLDGLVTAHVRSLMPDHLVDVVSTDKHTVKPWFAGHADVSPVVADFATQGYILVGGRADYVRGQRTAVTVYRHGAHTINVFAWVGSGLLSKDSTRSGYHLAFFREGNLDYCAVSDTGWDELHALVDLLKDLGRRENAS